MFEARFQLLLKADTPQPLAFPRRELEIDLNTDGMQEDGHPHLGRIESASFRNVSAMSKICAQTYRHTEAQVECGPNACTVCISRVEISPHRDPSLRCAVLRIALRISCPRYLPFVEEGNLIARVNKVVVSHQRDEGGRNGHNEAEGDDGSKPEH